VANSHFNPWSALFTDRQRLWIAMSDVGLLGTAAALYWAVGRFGAANVALYYGLPYLVVNAHLVLITYLQHTDTYVPHYRGEAFDFLRGSLATVDRVYGGPLDTIFHHITDTHVVHHLFHYLPWYHAQEATEAVKPLLGAYYLHDPTPIWRALYHSWSRCRFVEDEGAVVYFKGAEELAAGKTE